MSHQYLRLAEKPSLDHPGYPTCGACGLETERDDGSWICPSCGTSWSTDGLDAGPEEASLYPEWSGEEITGPICPEKYAWRVSGRSPEDRDRLLLKILEGNQA